MIASLVPANQSEAVTDVEVVADMGPSHHQPSEIVPSRVEKAGLRRTFII
jgi:hypothetical protein